MEMRQIKSSYVVLFKTHFWDDFCRRQLERLHSRVGRGDICIVIDETFGPAPKILFDRTKLNRLADVSVIGVTMESLEALRLTPITTHGSILWYNPDYPNYVASTRLATYDYYVPVEYDVVVNTDLDALIDRLATDGVDYLGFPIRKPVRLWPWFQMHKDIYGANMSVCLSCFSVFSRPALLTLLAARQERGLAFLTGALRFWPNNEAFIPNEIKRAGLRQSALDDYFSVRHYDWWPPTNEANLADVADQAFVHPVLSGEPFIRSVLFHGPSFFALIRRRGVALDRLKSFDPHVVNPMIRAEIWRRLKGKALHVAERLRLRQKWFAAARSGAPRATQQASAHNKR